MLEVAMKSEPKQVGCKVHPVNLPLLAEEGSLRKRKFAKSEEERVWEALVCPTVMRLLGLTYGIRHGQD
jgi:hypothetical protein